MKCFICCLCGSEKFGSMYGEFMFCKTCNEKLKEYWINLIRPQGEIKKFGRTHSHKRLFNRWIRYVILNNQIENLKEAISNGKTKTKKK